MTVGPIGPVGSVTAVTGLDATPSIEPVTGSGDAFGSILTEGVEKLQGLHAEADTLAVKAATGDLTDVHDYMIAAGKASTATQLTVAIRNKALEAYSEIMRMPV